MKQFLRRFFISASRALLFALCVAAFPICEAVDLRVEVSAVSSTQAILRYRGPRNRPCNGEVSESGTFLPLVHDVDPDLFEGARMPGPGRSTASTNMSSS